MQWRSQTNLPKHINEQDKSGYLKKKELKLCYCYVLYNNQYIFERKNKQMIETAKQMILD